MQITLCLHDLAYTDPAINFFEENKMKANVGGVDRILRIVVGLALIAWVLFAGGPMWAWLGVVVLATGVFNFCGAYALLGINTCKLKT
jgi:Protein of unknown function (DUF2892)